MKNTSIIRDGVKLVSKERVSQAQGARAMCQSIKSNFNQHPNRDITNDFVIEMCDMLIKGLEDRYGI